MIYFDNAATTVNKPSEVAYACAWAVNHLSSPGRGAHAYSMAAADIALECRERLAAFFNVTKSENVVFTLNATHALNIAIHSMARPGMRVVISGYEHNSVTRPLYGMGADVRIVRTTLFDREAAAKEFKRAIEDGAGLVVCTHVSNVFGFILPIEEICSTAKKAGVPVIIDASQSAGIIGIDFKALGADYIAMPGHKGLMGPQGTGVLLCSERPEPFIYGGSGSSSRLQQMPPFLPDSAEAGTHNMPGIAGLSAAVKHLLSRDLTSSYIRERSLVSHAAEALMEIEGVEVYYSPNDSVHSNVLSYTVQGVSPSEAAERLSKSNIAVRAGLHCAPTAHDTVGTGDLGTVRISFSPYNSLFEVWKFSDVMKSIAAYHV